MPDHTPLQVRLPDDVLSLLDSDPGIDRAELAGSRARDEALPLSDWDFKITTRAFADVRERLPALAARLHPVVAQWDRLSTSWCYMLILAGPVKVDMIFAQPHIRQPAWQISASTLPGMDDHFWDWALWLAAKQQAGKSGIVAVELAKLHEHLLTPLGITERPATVRQAIASYRGARHIWEQRLHFKVARAAEHVVAPALP